MALCKFMLLNFISNDFGTGNPMSYVFLLSNVSFAASMKHRESPQSHMNVVISNNTREALNSHNHHMHVPHMKRWGGQQLICFF